VCEEEIMARGKGNQNAAILEYALRHLETERDEIQAKIDHVRRQLGGKAASSSVPEAEPRRKRVLSEAARKRIAAAQKRRWAEHRKAQKQIKAEGVRAA
jgi:hypothetical protein